MFFVVVNSRCAVMECDALLDILLSLKIYMGSTGMVIPQFHVMLCLLMTFVAGRLPSTDSIYLHTSHGFVCYVISSALTGYLPICNTH